MFKEIVSLSTKFLELILVLCCAGCLIVPTGVFTRSPYRPEVLQELSQKGSNRDLVERRLGRPDLRYDDRYWFFVNSRSRLFMVELVSTGGSRAELASEDEWLVVQFDENGHVIFIERNNWGKCLSNGMCYLGDGIVTTPESEDSAAKSYQVRTDECGIYLFLDHKTSWLPPAMLKFYVDGKLQGRVNEKSYLFLTHPKGRFELTGGPAHLIEGFTGWSEREGYFGLPPLTSQCIGGEKLYFASASGFNWTWSQVNAAEGEAAVRARRRSLPVDIAKQ